MTRILMIILMTFATSSIAQEMQEIVVTGSRIDSYDRDTVPVVHIERRADFMLVSAYIESDSRDRDLRLAEVNGTLASLRKRAQSDRRIVLGLAKTFEAGDDEIEYVVPFEQDAVEMQAGRRADTTRVLFVVKTPIGDSDTSPEAVHERIEKFVDSVEVEGRAVVRSSGDPNLSIVNIAQYREPLLRRISDDSERLRQIFGDEYRVSITGLEEPVRWRLAGPMRLALYFPYYSSLQPRD